MPDGCFHRRALAAGPCARRGTVLIEPDLVGSAYRRADQYAVGGASRDLRHHRQHPAPEASGGPVASSEPLVDATVHYVLFALLAENKKAATEQMTPLVRQADQ